MEVSQNRDTPTCLFYNGKSENDMDDLGVALWLRKPPYLRNPQPGILDGPSSVWIYARVQKFWPRKKTRLRWFYSNPQLCSTKQQNIFNRRGFIQQNKSTKHPLSIDVSNIKPLAIMTLKRQTGSMDSLLWKSQTTKLKSIYLHYKAHTTLTGFTAKSSQSLVHPWKQLSPVSQNKIDCYVFGKKTCFGFFSPD